MAHQGADTSRTLVAAAERITELADTAELMGDADGAERLREQAQAARVRAMQTLDAESER